jgi:KDO2-lipid IV(A) lauroyltransferase
MKSQLTNRMLYGLLYLVSLLPLRALYGLSDFVTFVVYRIIGYRREVVLSNLIIAFPEKTDAERSRIAKAFYSNFTDSMLESIKLISAGDKLIDKMFVADPKVFEMVAAMDKNIQIHALHNFNWEIVK